MPRSMLFSRKRQTSGAEEEQPLPLMNQQASPALSPTRDEEEEDNSSFSGDAGDHDRREQEEEEEDGLDEEQEEADIDADLQMQHAGLPDPASVVAGQELNKALWCFMSIFNQQRQQLLQQQNLAALESNHLADGLNLNMGHQSAIPDTKQPVAPIQSSKRSQQRRQRKKQQVAQQQQPQEIGTPEMDYELYQSSRLHLDLNETEEDPSSPHYSTSSNRSPKKDNDYLASGSTSRGEDNHHCQDCGKVYSTSSNLARHRQTHRAVTDKKAKKCPDCNKVYVSMPAFSMHVRTHDRCCMCSFCGKRFSRPWLLQGHIRTHTGEKPFSCKTCDKAFADKSNLRAHIQTHSTTKPFVCDRCNKAFALKSYLCKHVDSTCMRATSSQKEPLNLKILKYSKRAKPAIR